MQLILFAQWVRTFSLRRYVHTKLNRMFEPLVERFVEWAFSFKSVQDAFVENISCRTPIGSALNHQIESVVEETVGNLDEVNASDVRGLEREVEDIVSRMDFEADNIRGLDRNIAHAVESAMEEFSENVFDDNSYLARHIAQRLSY